MLVLQLFMAVTASGAAEQMAVASLVAYDVYRTYFLQHGAMVQWIGSLWSLWSLTPYGGQSDDEDLPEGWPRAPGGRRGRSSPG